MTSWELKNLIPLHFFCKSGSIFNRDHYELLMMIQLLPQHFQGVVIGCYGKIWLFYIMDGNLQFIDSGSIPPFWVFFDTVFHISLAVERYKNNFPISGCIELRRHAMTVEFSASQASKARSDSFGTVIMPTIYFIFPLIFGKFFADWDHEKMFLHTTFQLWFGVLGCQSYFYQNSVAHVFNKKLVMKNCCNE